MKINVTQTFFPPISEYVEILERIWISKWLTNRGELVQELESRIKDLTKSNYCLALNNGTIPLQIALKLFGNGGEIITTPFSYIATTSSIVWESCRPIFVDIDPVFWTIDSDKIENAISKNTTCILATHVFGNVCDVQKIEAIAKKYNLVVVYDSAHCFGVNYMGKSIFNFGDISTCSFHATKVFHTGEGGMIFTQNKSIFDKFFYSHNFGHFGFESFHGVGINGKMSELNAAMGLAVLPYFDTIISKRKKIVEMYLSRLDGLGLQFLTVRNGVEWNYSYFPVLFNSENCLLEILKNLNDNDIFPRRYFFPSLNKVYYTGNQFCPISEDISSRILCLPLFSDLNLDVVDKISSIIKKLLC